MKKKYIKKMHGKWIKELGMGRQPTTRDGNWCFHWFVHRWRRHLVPTPVFSLKDTGEKKEKGTSLILTV